MFVNLYKGAGVVGPSLCNFGAEGIKVGNGGTHGIRDFWLSHCMSLSSGCDVMHSCVLMAVFQFCCKLLRLFLFDCGHISIWIACFYSRNEGTYILYFMVKLGKDTNGDS